MAVNYYFQSGVPGAYSATQRMVESMIVQALKINGMDMYYIPRTLIKVDTVLSEATVSEFKDAFGIEMYMENVQGFEGDGGFLSKFGINIQDSCTLVVARCRWEEEVGRFKKTSLNRPCEGDIIFMPLTQSFLEIKKVIADNPFYQLGKLFVYKLECDLFRYSSEEFNTGVDEIDNILNPKSLVEHDILMDDGTSEPASIDDVRPGAQNDVFNTERVNVIDFSESNPFGDVR